MTVAGLAHADDNAALPTWSFRGFGSVGVAYSGNSDAEYTSSILKANGVGYTRHWSSALDSRLGAQLNLNLDQQWSAVVQVIAEQRLREAYTPSVEWANIKYQATPDLSLRVGRIALPMFVAADYRKIGYAYPWARTPVEVYGTLTLTSSDGVDATYRWNRNGVKNVTQVFFGGTVMHLPTTRVEARKVAGFSHSVEYGALSARVSMLSTELTVDMGSELFGAMRQFGPQGIALADRYEVDHKHATEMRIGATYDPGQWFAMGELGSFRSRSFLGRSTSLYASTGYRVGNFTPYLGYARVRAASPASEPGLDLAGVPPAAAPAAAQLNWYLGEVLSTIPIQRTTSIGTRWDCATDVALKLQFDRVKPLAGSHGTFMHVQPSFRSGRSISVASAVLDFVF
ncbi:MAG: hypothetical protein JWQ01_1743 [Massilia sp.]|jgi:hypothetical protein|nr:hypothetical protein [Massilia sp.]